MLYSVFSRLYNTPIYFICIYIIVAIIVWTCLSLLLKRAKTRKTLNLIVFIIYLVCVFYITLISRTSTERYISLIPFDSFFLVAQYPDVLNQIAMNILMFVPLGLTLPYIFCKHLKPTLGLSVVCCFLISLIIEICQFLFGLGRCEIDDVIMNTFGAVLGGLSYLIYNTLMKRIIFR